MPFYSGHSYIRFFGEALLLCVTPPSLAYEKTDYSNGGITVTQKDKERTFSYRLFIPQIVQNWNRVTGYCPSARKLEADIIHTHQSNLIIIII